MSFKKTKLVMLSTGEKANALWWSGHKLYVKSPEDPTRGELNHLYFLSDEEIKEGDWFYYKHFGEDIISQAKDTYSVNLDNSDRYFKKIIATTDSNLTIKTLLFVQGENKEIDVLLPQPSQSFIEKFVEEYNKGNVITEVMVEYENYYASGALQPNLWQLKINPKDNTITIRKVKDSWNRDEVRELLITAYSKGRTNILLREFNEWLKENL